MRIANTLRLSLVVAALVCGGASADRALTQDENATTPLLPGVPTPEPTPTPAPEPTPAPAPEPTPAPTPKPTPLLPGVPTLVPKATSGSNTTTLESKVKNDGCACTWYSSGYRITAAPPKGMLCRCTVPDPDYCDGQAIDPEYPHMGRITTYCTKPYVSPQFRLCCETGSVEERISQTCCMIVGSTNCGGYGK